jgi:type I restriction enzyme S subunit
MPAGTVMLTKRAPVGAVVVNAVPMATNQGFLNFRCGKLLDPIFLCLWLRANKPYLDVVSNGSTYPELYPSDMFEFEISLPSIEEQRQITRLLLSLELAIGLGSALESSANAISSILEVQRETRELMTLRNLLLPKLLSGEVSVKNSRILEVAS